MLRVGQKVVCVDDRVEADSITTHGFRLSGDLDGLRRGQIYTIQRTGVHPFTGQSVVWLAELRRETYEGDAMVWGGEAPFFASRFRPVVERKTDISSLQALLNPSREKIEELWGAE